MRLVRRRGAHRPPAERLTAAGVSRSFEGITALGDVTLEIHRHEVVGLIGPNGAGKSTLVNIVTGFDAPSQGSVSMGDIDVTSWSAHRRGRLGLARTFQHGQPFTGLSVAENIEVAALASGASVAGARRTRDELMGVFDLSAVSGARAGDLSHGHERLLGVARALATDPLFLLMDEPAAGLNEVEIPDFASAIRSIRDDRGVGVLLIDHNIELIVSVCDRIHVLDQGRTIAEGTPDEIMSDPRVATAYLGETHV